MILKGAVEARKYGSELAELVNVENFPSALTSISEYLNDKNPFRLLDIVGSELAECSTNSLFPFLDDISKTRFEGGWVVIAAALRHHSNCTIDTRLNKCKAFIIQADIWYGADIFAERVPGPFLLSEFEQTLETLGDWRFDANVWIRRAVGVAAHFWAKRTRGEEPFHAGAQSLLNFLLPVFEENDVRAAKGIGWGLKTLGHYYPHITHSWLKENLLIQNRKPLAVVRRKALVFLPENLKADFTK